MATSKQQWPVESDPEARQHALKDPTSPEAAEVWVRREVEQIMHRAGRQQQIWTARAEAARKLIR